MSWLLDRLKNYGDKIAIIQNEKKYSYKELLDNINEIKSFLANKIFPQEVVALIGDYSFETISVFLFLYEHKNIIVPITTKVDVEINDRIKESYSDKVISIQDGNLKIVESNNYDEKHPLIKRLQENKSAGLILFSSGITGKPKAMIHDLDNLIDHYKDRKEKSLNIIVFLLFDHIGGLNTLINILVTGSTLVIPENRDVETICKLIQEEKVNVLPTTPSFLNLMLLSKAYERYDLSSLKLITYGTEPMPDILLTKLKETFPKVKFIQTFGTSETGIANTYSKASNSTFMKIDDPNLEYKIVDGELWLRSKTQILGYLNASMESFTEDGWFKTGDLVELTEDGYLKIIGRNKEIINVAGQKVLPTEVEDVLLQMQEIKDCLVYGEKNFITGETVVCDVVLNEGVNPSEIKKLIRLFCKDKLDGYKIPTKVNIVNEISITSRFKKIRRTRCQSQSSQKQESQE